MPSSFSHAIAGAACGSVPFAERVPRRVWWLAALCGALPDLDYVWAYGMPSWESWTAHRGFTHTPAFAACFAAGLAGVAFRGLGGRARLRVWAALTLAMASHGVLDALASYGPGIPFWFPFSTTRYKLPWQPISAGPGPHQHGIVAALRETFGQEVLWIWLPSLFLLLLTAWRRRTRRAHASA